MKAINFSSEMVKALLAGKKTQTRRVVKIHPNWPKCSYGDVGDILYVREPFLPDPNCDSDIWDEHSLTYYEWSGCGCVPAELPRQFKNPDHCIYQATFSLDDLNWKTAKEMPKWASRITIKITDVKVERLQNLSHDDALAEGIDITEFDFGDGHVNCYHLYGVEDSLCNPIDAFKEQVWQPIYPKGHKSWAENPLVWVICYEVVEVKG